MQMSSSPPLLPVLSDNVVSASEVIDGDDPDIDQDFAIKGNLINSENGVSHELAQDDFPNPINAVRRSRKRGFSAPIRLFEIGSYRIIGGTPVCASFTATVASNAGNTESDMEYSISRVTSSNSTLKSKDKDITDASILTNLTDGKGRGSMTHSLDIPWSITAILDNLVRVLHIMIDEINEKLDSCDQTQPRFTRDSRRISYDIQSIDCFTCGFLSRHNDIQNPSVSCDMGSHDGDVCRDSTLDYSMARIPFIAMQVSKPPILTRKRKNGMSVPCGDFTGGEALRSRRVVILFHQEASFQTLLRAMFSLEPSLKRLAASSQWEITDRTPPKRFESMNRITGICSNDLKNKSIIMCRTCDPPNIVELCLVCNDILHRHPSVQMHIREDIRENRASSTGIIYSVPIKFHGNCRCGGTTRDSSSDSCVSNRCPCFKSQSGCVGCGCLRCNNPYRPSNNDASQASHGLHGSLKRSIHEIIYK